MTDRPKKLLILAYNHREFVDFCHDHDLNPRDTRTVVYVPDPDRLRGYHGDWIINLGPKLPPGMWDFFIESMDLQVVHGFMSGKKRRTRFGMGVDFWSPWWCFCGAGGTGSDLAAARRQYDRHLKKTADD